jgi:hypothetical protein
MSMITEEKPKKIMTTYQVYCFSVFADIKKENPDATLREILPIINTEWKALTKEEQDSYVAVGLAMGLAMGHSVRQCQQRSCHLTIQQPPNGSCS